MLYLNWKTHPRDVSNSKLHLLYNDTLQTCSDLNNLIICYSRPKNLRDSLMKTKLCEPEGMKISNLLQNNETGIRWGFILGEHHTTLQASAPEKFCSAISKVLKCSYDKALQKIFNQTFHYFCQTFYKKLEFYIILHRNLIFIPPSYYYA
jgi:hypothetical protein